MEQPECGSQKCDEVRILLPVFAKAPAPQCAPNDAEEEEATNDVSEDIQRVMAHRRAGAVWIRALIHPKGAVQPVVERERIVDDRASGHRRVKWRRDRPEVCD
jgi:hypothetical protein